MKKSGKIALTVLQFGVVAAMAGGFWWNTQSAMQPTVVYKLAQDVPLNSKIGPTDFVKVEIPKDAVTKSMIQNPEEYIDLHASSKLFADQYATKDMFVTQDDVDPFEIEDLSKLRKATLPATYVDAVGGHVKYGDRVDLVYVDEGEAGEGGTFTYSNIFMQDVLVYSVTTEDGFRYEDRTERVKGSAVASSEDEEVASEDTGNLSQITLAVTPAQAEELAARVETGTVKIVGRFKESKNQDPAGFIIGDYEKVFTGNQLGETNENR